MLRPKRRPAPAESKRNSASSDASRRVADERNQAERASASEIRVPYEVVDEPEAGPASAASLIGERPAWDPAEHDVGRDGLVTAAEVLNISPKPIFDVTVFWMAPNGTAQLDSRHVDALQIEPFGRIRKQRPLGLLPGIAGVPVEVEFTDAAGLRWRKDRAGGLLRLDNGATTRDAQMD
ncbi:hypothetical protein [Curtobacterium sp. 1544]|uniref:hypothetical protein n=1 Tax=Curtobacterium sp. 1544 TaxID=3156417 RepID=UPI00339937A2